MALSISKSRARIAFALVATAFAVAGCDDEPPPYEPPKPPPYDPGDPPPDDPTACTPEIQVVPSVVFHDMPRLETRFALRKTLAQIASTAVTPGGTPETLLQSMLDSFAAQSFANGAHTIPVVPRPEASLDVAQLLDPSAPDGMIPTGLFNRFDLIPQNGEHCGEFRITYAKKQSGTPGRFLLIFEGVLRNPNPSGDLAGCKPITDFWANLSADPDLDHRADELERFYYQGLGAPIGPVVHHANYGAVGLGQVRSNLFIQPSQWSLREHVTDGADARFVPVTVKNNPLVELFRLPATLPPGFTPAEQTQFRNEFIDVPLCQLLRPDRANPNATADDVINGIGMQIDDSWNDFESISHPAPPGPDDPSDSRVDPAMMDLLTVRLTSLGSPITASQALHRAGAMTCAGCHRFSDGQDLANGIHWPPPVDFVHIDEQGALSGALSQHLLPRRRAFLQKFFCEGSVPQSPDAPCPPPEGGARVARAAAEPFAELLKRAEDARANASERVRTGAEIRATESERSTLEESARAVRAAERALPGAFVPVRRTH